MGFEKRKKKKTRQFFGQIFIFPNSRYSWSILIANIIDMWLITVPNNKESPDTTYCNIQNNVSVNGLCKTFLFDVPNLVVGTLDTLMALSDDLGKICNQVDVRLSSCFVQFYMCCIFVILRLWREKLNDNMLKYLEQIPNHFE